MIDRISLFEDQCLGFQNIANHLRQIAKLDAPVADQYPLYDAANTRGDHGVVGL